MWVIHQRHFRDEEISARRSKWFNNASDHSVDYTIWMYRRSWGFNMGSSSRKLIIIWVILSEITITDHHPDWSYPSVAVSLSPISRDWSLAVSRIVADPESIHYSQLLLSFRIGYSKGRPSLLKFRIKFAFCRLLDTTIWNAKVFTNI